MPIQDAKIIRKYPKSRHGVRYQLTTLLSSNEYWVKWECEECGETGQCERQSNQGFAEVAVHEELANHHRKKHHG